MLVMLCGTIRADGYDFYVGRVYYRIILGNDMKPTTNVEVVKGDEKYSGDIVIPSSITVNKNEYTVTRIGQDAFYDCKSVTSISLPNSITSKLEVIEGRAFGNCEGLTSIKIPDSVTEIGQFAFLQCTNLKTVYMGRGLKTVRYNAFGYCEALERVEISDLAAWCGIAFYYNGSASGWFGPHANPLSYAGHLYLNGEEVVDLVIPKEVTSIHGDLNFCGCVGLKSVTFPDDCNVEYIGAFTFQGCENIKSLKLNKHLKRIYECAFSGCKSIESLVIPDEVTLISCAAFSGCSSLKELKLGNALEVIETGFWGPAFGGTSVTEIVVPEKIKNLNGFWNSKLSIVNIGKTSLTEISGTGRDAILPIERINITDLATFMGIKKQLGGYDLYLNGNLVEDLTIPSSVSEIGERAMQGCQRLKNITIPSHVKTINDKAFNGCYYIETITFEGGSPTIGKDVFGTYNNTYIISKMREPSGAPNGIINECQRRNILCVPAGCKETYGTAEGWNTFRYIVEASGPEEAFLDRGNLYRIYGDEVTLVKGGAHAYWGYYLPETATYQDKTYPITVIGGEVHDGFSPDIVIYAGVKQIVEKAFANCTGVHTVTSYIKNPYAINSNVFSAETKQSAILKVPYGTKAKYQSTDGWKEFANIEEMDPEPSEPYVVYNNGTLTFYYDNQRSSRTGTTYDLNEGNERPGWSEYSQAQTITKAVFDASFADARPTSTCSWFFGFTNLTDIEGISYLNTSNATIMSYMFYDCSGLTNLDVSGFSTSNVTDMGSMFSGCSSLTSLDVSGFNTSKVTAMNGLFNSCSSLTSLDVSGFNTSNVTGMSSMFSWCSSLESLDVSGFNTSNVTNMNSMFYVCSSLTNLDVSGFNTSNVIDLSYMFNGCSSLTSLDVSSFKASPYINGMFGGCSGLTNLIIGSQFTSDESTYMDALFANCIKLCKVTFTSDIPASINNMFFDGVGTADAPATLNVPEQYKANYAAKFDGNKFYGGYFQLSGSDVNPPIAEAEPYAVYNDGILTFYCDNQRSRWTGTTYDLNEGSNKPGWLEQKENITKAVFDASFANARPTSTSQWFNQCGSLVEINGIENLNTSEVLYMAGMFYHCSSLNSLDVSHFDTSKAKAMHVMFSGCSSLTSLNLGNFNTQNVVNMGEMFSDCTKLTALVISSFDTSNTKYMEGMFYNCSSLQRLDLQSFDTRKVKQSNGLDILFRDCISLKQLSFGAYFVSSDEIDCSNIFYGCNSLETITFVGDIPASINSQFFSGVGTAKVPAILVVPEEYQANYESKFVDGIFYGGYFALSGSGENPPVVDGVPYVVYNDGTLTFYCDNQRSSRLGTTYDLNVGEEEPAWYENRSSVTKVVFDSSFASARPTTGHEWFDGCISLTEIEGMEYLNTSEMTFMDEMFFFCNSLSSVDLSHFDTSNVTDMRAMFSGCSGLMSVDLSHFDTPNVKNVGAMFYSCSSLTEIDLSNFDTSKATTNYLFRDCTNLREVTFGQKFESSEHQWFVDAFDGCTSIKTIKFTGDIPACINSKFFTGVGTSDAPATLIVPGQYKDNYQAKFDGKKFFSGYFVLKTFSDDGVMNKEDIAEVVSEILNPSEEYDPNKDVNHDGVVNVADVVELVNIINSGEGTGSGYFWMGNYFPNSNNFPTINGKEVEGIVTTYTSLGEAMAKASRTYFAGEWAVVMYPSSWGTKDDLVFLDSENKKYYATKQKKLSDFPDYLYYESTEKIGDNTTITLSTVVAAKATGATLSSPKIQ